MRTVKTFVALTTTAMALAMAAPASAAIVIKMDDSICNSCTNVHIPDDDGTDGVVYGSTEASQPNLNNVIFTGAPGENIIKSSPGGGLVWVGDTDGTTTFIDVATVAGTTFSRFGFNVNEYSGNDDLAPEGDPDWGIRITAFYSGGGQEFQDFTGFNNNTQFSVESFDDLGDLNSANDQLVSVLQRVTVQLLDGSGGLSGPDGFTYQYDSQRGPGVTLTDDTAYLEAFGQFKIDGVQTVAAIPESSTWAMMLLGFGGIGMSIRARKHRAAMRVVAS